MSKLSLREIAQSQLDSTPVIDGQLIVCLDTGNAYRDTATAHVKIGSDLEVVSDLPLAPLAEKLYYLKPDKLYVFLGGNWTLLNDKTIDLDEVIAKLPAGSSTSLNDDVEIIAQDTDITQPHYYRRKLVVLWEYIKTKAQDFFAAKNHKHEKTDITDFPTSMPASDVYPWAKAATKPSYTKAEVGLGKVDNTADADKTVKRATTAGTADSANSVAWKNVKNKPTAFPVEAHTHDDRYYTEAEVDGKLNEKLHEASYQGDLNDLTTTGLYHLYGTNTNVPANGNATVYVDFNVGTPYQVWTYDMDGTTYRRTRSGGAWTSWTQLSFTDTKDWASITGKPSTFPPEAHTHDDRYYTEAEINSKLSGKVDNTEAGANGLFSKLSVWTAPPTDDTYFMRQDTGGTNQFGRVKFSTIWNYIKGKADGTYQPKGSYAASGHTHDDRYYTEAEVDGKLTEKLHEETITDARDLNTIKITGVYHLKTTSYTNGPGISNHATIFVDYTVGTPYQIFIPDSVNRAWRRNHVNSNDTWSAWTELKYTDTNTWRGIQNNLTSDSTSDSLSAAQGKVLKGLIDGKAPNEHTHSSIVGHTAGNGFNFGYSNSKDVTIPKETAVSTYYVKILSSTPFDFRFKKMYVRTAGDNTGYSFIAQVSANAYMPPHIELITQQYNSPEIKNIIVASAPNYCHSIYLEVDSSTKVTKTIYIQTDFSTDASLSLSKIKPSDIQLTVPIRSNDHISTSIPICADGGILGNLNGKAATAGYADSAGSVAWGNISGKPSSYPPASHSHAYIPLSGGTISGALNFANGTWNLVGDDAYMGDHNIGGSFCIMGANDTTRLALVNKDNQGDYALVEYGGGNLNFNKKLGANITGHADGDLSLSGGTINGDIVFSNCGTGVRQIQFSCADNDYGRVAVGGTASNAGYMEIATADDGSEPIYVRQYSGVYANIVRTATLLDGSGNTSFPGSVTANTYYAPNWFRATGDSGFYFENHGGGWYMIDDIWIRAYNNKNIYTPGVIQCDSGFNGNLNGHASSDLALSGGTMTGNINFAGIGDNASSAGITWGGSTDGAGIYYQTTESDQGNLVLNLTDDNNCYLRIAQNGNFRSYFSPSDGNFHGNVNGNCYGYADYLYNEGVGNMRFHWSGQNGQPTWLWGSNDGSNAYVWNPSNFSVNYAATAGNGVGASKVITDKKSGYIRFNNGIQICWGSENCSSKNTTVVFAIPFINNEYAVTITGYYDNFGGTYWTTGSHKETQFNINGSKSSIDNRYMNWIAIGQWFNSN